MVPPIVWKAAALALLVAVGVGAGATATVILYAAPKIAQLTEDLGIARRSAVLATAAREAVEQQCLAGSAATGLRDEVRDAGQRAIDDATRELDHAPTDSDDPLRALFDRVRAGQEPAGRPGDPGPPAGNPVPRAAPP